MKRYLMRMTWAFLALPLLLVNPASAQYELGTGRGLDRNLQQGSGGVNPQATPGVSGQYGNAIVTGNVPGLSGFRGNVGYSAPGEFRGRLGSDDLFNFRRQAYPTQPYQAPPSIYDQYTTAPVPTGAGGPIILRPGTGTFSGDLAGQSTLYGRSYSIRSEDYSSLNVSRRPYEPRVQGMLESPRLGLIADEQGRLLEMNATPLTGLSTRPLATRYDRPTEEPNVEGPVPITPQEERETPIEPGAEDELDARLEIPDLATAQRFGEAQQPSDARIDARVNARIEARQEASIAGELLTRTAAAPGEDVYLDLLRQIDQTGQREGQRQDAQTPADQLAQARQAPMPEDETRARNRLLPQQEEQEAQGRGAQQYEEQLDQSFQAYRQSRERAEQTRQQEEQAERSPWQPRQQRLPGQEEGEAAEGQLDQRMTRGQLPDRLDYQLPPLTSFAGTGENELNEALAKAEELMQAEQYFAAEDAYSQAELIQPGHPLAQVGRIHAQLGAGLHLSAAYNLQRLFLEHPELIAARYTQPLLPSEARLETITSKIQAQAGRTDEPGFPLLLAYLAYQQNQLEQVRTHLNRFAELAPEHPLVEPLRQIWLGGGQVSDGPTN